MQKKSIRIIVWTNIFILITVSFWSEINTFLWHFKNPKPISWNNLKIAIPQSLVAEISKKRIYVYNLNEPEKFGIQFSIMDFKMNNELLNSYILKTKKEITEKLPCPYPKTSCIWIKTKDKQNSSYEERIFFNSHSFYISFGGLKDYRNYFTEIINSLDFS